jgi:myo-inositol-1(or 4)-monophosphatase
MLSNNILSHLHHLFQAVSQAVSQTPPQTWAGNQRNAKGDDVKWFDLAADKAVCTYLEQEFPYSVILLSEEGEPRQFGAGSPQFIMVLDPVDGSENFARGLAPSGIAISLSPTDTPLAVDTIEYAFVGNLFTQEKWWAQKNGGAFFNGKPIQSPKVTNLAEILISCDFNHYLVEPAVNRLLVQARGVRSFGAATLALVTVAMGQCQIHLDARHTLTPENFLAPALLITESGGLITDALGNPLPPIQSLTEKFTLLASTNPTLHALALECLQKN